MCGKVYGKESMTHLGRKQL